MNAFGAVLTLLSCAGILACKRRYAALVFIAATLYITQGQTLNVGINFMAIRFVELAAFARIVFRKDLRAITLTSVDWWMLIFTWTHAVVYCMRIGEVDAYQVGLSVDATLVYLAFRALVRDFDDFEFLVKGSVFLLAPIAIVMLEEARSGYNMFSLMGGVPAQSNFRDGHYRAQAGFRISITAGSLGATWVALFVGYLVSRKSRWWAAVGILSCFAILTASHSSGPLMAAVAVIVAWGCWFIRARMTLVRRGIVVLLLILHVLMSKPVWFIFDRISGIVGGDGWHRSNLIDKFLYNYAEWGMLGMPIEATGDWAATKMPWGGVDVTNFYVATGIDGGLISFIFIFVFLTKLYSLIGKAGASLRAQGRSTLREQLLHWSIACAVTSHVINLTAVVYWDQFYVVWYCHLAIAASLSNHILQTPPPDPEGAGEDDTGEEPALSEPRPFATR